MSLYQVDSQQTKPHDKLSAIVSKHLRYNYRKPIPDRQYRLFQQAYYWIYQQNSDVILDMGCGVGKSSVMLAKAFPDYMVLGIDKSLNRLKRNPYFNRDRLLSNLLLLPANNIDFWRLSVDFGLPAVKQYILYPNPYPKKNDVTLRWPGHPVMPWIVAASPAIEVRSNWQVYLQEFVQAACIIKPQFKCQWLSLDRQQQPLTHFERKYWRAGVSTEGVVLY